MHTCGRGAKAETRKLAGQKFKRNGFFGEGGVLLAVEQSPAGLAFWVRGVASRSGVASPQPQWRSPRLRSENFDFEAYYNAKSRICTSDQRASEPALERSVLCC